MKSLNVLASVKNPHALRGNLGDIFGYLLMEHYCDQYNVNVNRMGVDDKIEDDTFAVVGSIINLCHNKVKAKEQTKKIHILGCGLIIGNKIPENINLNYIGVRGPKTSALLPKQSDVMSDPGLLISKLFELPENAKKDEVGYIIHSVDREAFFSMFPDAKENLINNYANYNDFLYQLSQYKYVVSSSLHGAIFCHAFNIPVCAIRITDKITGDNFKYQDYYHSLGNTEFEARVQVTAKTNFRQLVENAWQPTRETVRKLQEKQESIIKKAIEEAIK